MNLENIALLVNEELTTIQCSFNAKDDKTYTYVCHRDLAKELKVGNFVVVERQQPGCTNMTVVRVVEIHEESEVDPDQKDFTYRWVVDKVNGSVDILKESQNESVAKLKAMRRKSYRQRLIEEYKAGVLLEGDS